MAHRIAAKQHETIRDAVADILKHVNPKDFLQRRRMEKVSAVAPVSEEVIRGAVAALRPFCLFKKKIAEVLAISAISAKTVEPEKSQPRTPRRAGREDKCFRCHKFGHFVKECGTSVPNQFYSQKFSPACTERG